MAGAAIREFSPVAAPGLGQLLRDFADLARPACWVTPAPAADLPRGDGHYVLFAPGIGSGDFGTLPVRRFVRALGYEAVGWELGANLGPTSHIVRGLEARLFALNERSGRRVSLIGRSLGGVLLRELAKRHPERVRRLILVCSPVRHPVPSLLAPLVHAFDGAYDPEYPRDPVALSRPAPVPTTALYTKTDGYIGWGHCLEEPGPLAENVELPGARHCTAAMDSLALRRVAERLAIPDRP